MDFHQIIKTRLEELGASPIRLALDNGLPRDAIRSVLRGHPPTIKRAREIAKALGLEFYVGLPRPAEHLIHSESYSETGLSPAQLRDLESSTHTLVRVVSDAGGNPIPDDLRGVLLHPDEVAEPGSSYDAEGVVVDIISEVRAAAGAGAEVWDETVTDKLVFRRSWLAKHSLTASECSVIRTMGDSMEPTLPSGCSILVNRASRRRLSGRVYVMRTEDGLIAKRLTRADGGTWLVTSDNPEYRPRPMADTDEIIGEVIWQAKTLR